MIPIKEMNRRTFLRGLAKLGSTAAFGALIISTNSCDVLSSGAYSIDSSKCNGCGDCISSCPHDAITLSEGKAHISSSACIGCGKCVGRCDQNAISR